MGQVNSDMDPCPKCGGFLEWKTRKDGKVNPGQKYYFKRWLACQKCGTPYYQESEKVYVTEDDRNQHSVESLLQRIIELLEEQNRLLKYGRAGEFNKLPAGKISSS